ncbi:MAG: hypothetical protein M3Y72_16200 [Acidobacteriota bacterium]|nr:hypothetical protein [Acidobacteriota bacterium]
MSSSSTGSQKHDWKGAFFFAVAVAVGLTPEMLPMIVSVCLSKGALAMSRKKGASSNFGNMFSVLGASAFLPFIPMPLSKR